jgi:hypothetical protein
MTNYVPMNRLPDGHIVEERLPGRSLLLPVAA